MVRVKRGNIIKNLQEMAAIDIYVKNSIKIINFVKQLACLARDIVKDILKCVN